MRGRYGNGARALGWQFRSWGSAFWRTRLSVPVFGFRKQTAPIIRSQTDLVILPVSVTNHKGRFVPDLAKQYFRVYENGQAQSISEFSRSDVPVTAGLVIDSSGSMAPNRREVAEAAKDFLESSNPQDQIFAVNFNEKVSLGLPSGDAFTSNVGQLEAAVLRGPSTGMTALYHAISVALKHLEAGSEQKKALIIISDGGDNASRESFRQVLNSALHSHAILYTIGIMSEEESDVNPSALRKLAKATGGRAFFRNPPRIWPESARRSPAIFGNNIRSRTRPPTRFTTEAIVRFAWRCTHGGRGLWWSNARRIFCSLRRDEVFHGRRGQVTMRRGSMDRGSILRKFSGVCFLAGALILSICGLLLLQARIYQARETRRLAAAIAHASARKGEDESSRASYAPTTSRIEKTGAVLGELEIPSVGIKTLILEGDDAKTLRLGAGHIPHTSMPGASDGNVVIAAHRDTYFRPLRHILTKDIIILDTPAGSHRYSVQFTKVVSPYDVEVLNNTQQPTLTLVTCYPFYFVGPAPRRFIVRAVGLEDSLPESSRSNR